MENPWLVIFYDGNCGLCHRAVRFALQHDPDGSRFRFAPLQGTTLRQQLNSDIIKKLTDSIVVLDPNGAVYQQSDGVLLMLKEIRGAWAFLGRVVSIVPRPLRDLAYRAVARIRHRLFRRPEDLCPLVPLALRERFLA